MAAHTCTLAFERVEAGSHEVKASLDYSEFQANLGCQLYLRLSQRLSDKVKDHEVSVCLNTYLLSNLKSPSPIA